MGILSRPNEELIEGLSAWFLSRSYRFRLTGDDLPVHQPHGAHKCVGSVADQRSNENPSKNRRYKDRAV
jgi:hypothetical protein